MYALYFVNLLLRQSVFAECLLLLAEIDDKLIDYIKLTCRYFQSPEKSCGAAFLPLDPCFIYT